MTSTSFEFDSITESGPLVDELRARIAAGGPITFREFMASALYHPRWGYYARGIGVAGRAGDYVTSTEVHPVFGAIVAKQLAELWRAMGSRARFAVVEQGAGSGALARDIIAAARRQSPRFAAAIRYVIVEPLPRLRAVQSDTLDGVGGSPVTWCEEPPAGIEGVVLSNELVDSFPVHRVVVRDGLLLEVHVDMEDGSFTDCLAGPSTPRLAAYFDELQLLPGEGCRAEVNLDAVEWMASVARSLRRGYALTFDYGYEARQLYAPWRRDGTLLCFYRQSSGSDPYQRVGRQDMTTSVDFTTLGRAGEANGLATLGSTDQSSFLTRLGIHEALARIAQERPDDLEEYFARRKVVLDLTDPARLGRVRVLLQEKDAPRLQFTGFDA